MTDNEKEAPTDDAVQEAMMNLLEMKLDAFMNRADLSDSPPADKVAIRAGFFLGVTAGMSIANTIGPPAANRQVLPAPQEADNFTRDQCRDAVRSVADRQENKK